MKFLFQATIPHEAFNAAILDGSIGDKMHRIMDSMKPEAVYFTAINGKRNAIMVINMNDASELPALSEPWFILFNADVNVSPFMTPEDLGKANLDEIGKKWGK